MRESTQELSPHNAGTVEFARSSTCLSGNHMGEHNVEQEVDEKKTQVFMKALLEDLRALAFMLADGRVESGVKRIGAEQEMFLIDRHFKPAPVSLEVLKHANDARLTTEIARFNLEANLTPLELTDNCFSRMERELQQLMHLAHDNIMMESCNTSFQVHFQSNAQDFANHYNIAQAITAPVLAIAVNSPLLFGQRLWQETRVALFQHSTDERSRPQLARNQPTRVSFGDSWLENSVIELFHDQITRFRPIMITQPDENPFQVLARGETPLLSALRMHNGTVWRWNRACYGVTGGVAHLRIENRALPSGPTVVDEIANAAFFTGLMSAFPQAYGNIAQRMIFDDAKLNFFRAARHGLDAQFQWIDGQSYSAAVLILDHLLPLARQGLSSSQVASTDIDKYLGIIEERTRNQQTGARWIMKSLSAMDNSTSKDAHQRRLTSAMLVGQKHGAPIHRWSILENADTEEWEQGYQTVGQFMSTDLFTVGPDDLIALAASVMDWRHIRHVPVEDKEGRLVGLVTHRALLRTMNNRGSIAGPTTVREVMIPDPMTISPLTPSLEAIEIMRSNRVGCLPVVEGNQLAGIVTSYDFLAATAKLFQQHLAAHTKEETKSRARAQGGV